VHVSSPNISDKLERRTRNLLKKKEADKAEKDTQVKGKFVTILFQFKLYSFVDLISTVSPEGCVGVQRAS